MYPWVYLAWLVSASSATASDVISLTTPLGQLEGKKLTTPAGNEYFAFTSVPYAQPPLHHLRLKNPVLQEGWPGVLDATKPTPICVQTPIFAAYLRNITMGQEDCLYLNIFTRSTDPTANLPVMIYVHGGGFRCGMAAPPDAVNAESNFMNHDIVLVSVHYRLGTLGFLSTEDSEIPGNFGLKDQAMAIKWVSRNVRNFGGDPDSMTVFGESAGGASAHYLITSPLSRDLLKGGIAESGLIDATWALSEPGKARKVAAKLAEVVGCDVNKELLQCLRDIDPNELQLAETKLLTWDFDPAVVFQPVVEVENEGAFLTENPTKMKSTKPLMTGISKGEGVLKTISINNQEDYVLDEFVNNIDKLLPSILFLDPDTPGLENFIAAIKAKYFKDLSNRKDILKGLDDFYTDAFFVYPLAKTLQRHKGPKYVYLFDHRAENSVCSRLGPKKNLDPRACHGDELLSLFNWTNAFPGTKGREEDRIVSNQLVELWLNFGNHQVPAPPGYKINWEEYKNGENFLHIKTKKFEMKRKPFPNRDVVKFWEEAYKIISPSIRNKVEL